MSKICPICKTELPDESNFCLGCGYRFAGAEPEQTAPFETPQPVKDGQNAVGQPMMYPEQQAQEAQFPYQQYPQAQYPQAQYPQAQYPQAQYPQSPYPYETQLQEQQPPYQPPIAPPPAYYNQYYYAQVPKKPSLKGTPGRGFGIASMVLGIIAVINALSLITSILTTIPLRNLSFGIDAFDELYSTTMIVSFIANMVYVGILGGLALVFALVSRGRGYKHQSTAGLIMGSISLAALLISVIVFIISRI